MTLQRDINNYGALSFSFEDTVSDEIKTFYAIPVRLFYYRGTAELSIEVWESKDAFESNQTSLAKWSKTFRFSPEAFGEIRANFDTLFDEIEEAAFSFIDESNTEYALEVFDINLTTLEFKVEAVNTTSGKTCQRKTRNLAEFESVKAQYPELVTAYFQFAWIYAKTNDQKLAKFN